MAVDQNVSSSAPETARAAAIDNEIPAYRAISPPAVVSLILGILGLLSFANWFFLIFAAGAVLLGVYADRKIRRDPEIWTGRTFAQLGTALGLVFGLAAVTVSLVQGLVRSQDATRFSRMYAEVLKKDSPEVAYWYTIQPASRDGKSAVELYDKAKKQARHPQEFEMMMGGASKLKKHADSLPGTDIHFVRLETHGIDGVHPFATALLEVHSPASKDTPASEEYALLYLKATSLRGKYHWWIEESKYPYQPSTFTVQPKAVDDGHGHSHSH